MRKTLEPFQKQGAERLAANLHHLLADQPGLGKTIQAIAACEAVGARKVLVVCPASVRPNWHAEFREWGFRGEWTVVSYDGARGEPGKAAYNAGPYDVFIPDEAHFCKNLEAERTRAVLGKEGLARRARYVWPMTGTPVLNRPVELYPILKTLHPVFAKMSFAAYTARYCGAFFDGRQMNVRGATRIAELAELLRPFMTRRTKRQVFPDRATPLVSRINVGLTARERAALVAGPEPGEQSRVLRQLGLAKVPHVARFVREQLEGVEKIAVYAHHRDVIAALAGIFQDVGCVVYQGGMGDARKTAAVSRFQGQECRVFIGERQAAGLGINGLQRVCSTVVIAEPSWGPGETEQIIDRLDRIGQADEIVNAYLVYAAGTEDNRVLKTHDRKVGLVGQLVGDHGQPATLGDLA